jgi:hypothetical protein
MKIAYGKILVRLACVLMCGLFTVQADALGGPQYVTTNKGGVGNLALVQQGKAIPLYVGVDDWSGVIRAVGDLSDDVKRVTGVQPQVVKDRAGLNGVDAVLIGTIGRSAVIDDLVKRRKIDVSGVQGKWEGEVTTIVERPMPGVKRALVIAGADKRGTIYGVYDLSEEIGVSPWYWWADVRVTHQDALFILPERHVLEEPAVKYRGIFFNDEAPALTGWVNEKFGGYNSKFYTKVFELLLRMKANFLWPAMWNAAFAADDPLNAKLADEYGIVMSTSHEEPMMRAEKEWTWGHHGAWDYTTNAKEIEDFWRTGMERDKSYEQVVTLGMRGANDTAMSPSTNTELLEKIVADQRQILKETVNPDLTKVPQVWALYKEVQTYYEKGMRVPDDVTMLWSDDNWGNLRRLPTAEERKRPGGAGIYYHFDYVGGPRSYKWLNVISITKVQEQMNLALAYGANRIWVVNVGDGKPMEFPIEFFLSMARTPERWTKDHLDEYTKLWAKREFGEEHAEEIASAVEEYTKYNGRRKPELLEPTTYSLTNYREAERVEADWKALAERVDKLAGELPEDERASYFELVQYPVDACANLGEMYIAAGRNALYARQGRPDANDQASLTRSLFAKDAELSDEYNRKLLNGKWNHMMDQTHIGYVLWNDPPLQSMPAVTQVQVPERGAIGVSAEGGVGFRPSLGVFDSVAQQTKRLTLFDRGRTPVAYQISASAPWIVLSKSSGTVDKEETVEVHVDWGATPAGRGRGTVTVKQEGAPALNVQVESLRLDGVTRENVQGFVESDGYVAMEAADTTRRIAGRDAHWEELPGFGETKSAMTVSPVTAASDTNSGAGLEYRMYLYDSGEFTMQAVLAPTLNFVPGRGLRFAVSVDDGPHAIVDALEHNDQKDWAEAVSDGVKKVSVPLPEMTAGYHTLKIWMVDPAVVLERIVVSHGMLRPSYLGPPESFHGVGAGQ